jgi:hypothetical protein
LPPWFFVLVSTVLELELELVALFEFVPWPARMLVLIFMGLFLS